MMTNSLIVAAKITTAIVCFLVGCMMGILEMLFFDKRRNSLDS